MLVLPLICHPTVAIRCITNWWMEVFVYSQWTCMVKFRVCLLSRAALVMTHWTTWWLISLLGIPNSELIVVVVPLPCSVELVVVLSFPARSPVSHLTSAGGLEAAAVQVTSETSLSPKTGGLASRLETGGTTTVTVHSDYKNMNNQIINILKQYL